MTTQPDRALTRPAQRNARQVVEDAPPRSEIEVPTRGAGVGHTQLRQERARCRLCLLTQGLRPGWRAFSALYGRRIWVAESQLVQNSSIFGLKKDHFQIWRFLELARARATVYIPVRA